MLPNSCNRRGTDTPLTDGVRTPNLSIDVNADYRRYSIPALDEYGNLVMQDVFGTPEAELAYAPLTTGGFPGGIATTNPRPHPIVFGNRRRKEEELILLMAAAVLLYEENE